MSVTPSVASARTASATVGAQIRCTPGRVERFQEWPQVRCETLQAGVIGVRAGFGATAATPFPVRLPLERAELSWCVARLQAAQLRQPLARIVTRYTPWPTSTTARRADCVRPLSLGGLHDTAAGLHERFAFSIDILTDLVVLHVARTVNDVKLCLDVS